VDDSFPQFGLKALATLFVMVDPLGVAPSFVALTVCRNRKANGIRAAPSANQLFAARVWLLVVTVSLFI